MPVAWTQYAHVAWLEHVESNLVVQGQGLSAFRRSSFGHSHGSRMAKARGDARRQRFNQCKQSRTGIPCRWNGGAGSDDMFWPRARWATAIGR